MHENDNEIRYKSYPFNDLGVPPAILRSSEGRVASFRGSVPTGQPLAPLLPLTQYKHQSLTILRIHYQEPLIIIA